jgi:senataxin
MGERERAKSCAVVFCTLATAGRSDLRDLLRFRDLLVVDEAGQATEPDVISAADASHASRLILCGDPLQLPPILNCRDQTGGLRVSALERLLDVGERDDVSFRFLDVQRRMHPSIARYPNGAYYAGRVADAESVRTRDEPDWLADARRRDERLRELPPRSVLDTRGAMRRVGTSSANDEEVRVVVELVAALLRDAPRDADVAVISFYAAQVRALQDALEPGAYPGLRVGSVDAFQGSEADVVLISCVRAPQGGGSSDRGDDLGFVADELILIVEVCSAVK